MEVQYKTEILPRFLSFQSVFLELWNLNQSIEEVLVKATLAL